MDKNQGYAILKAVMLENGRGFALGEHPTAPSPYVTWACYDDKNGQRQYEWGHYRNMKADYDHQTTTLTAVLEKLTAERAELASGVDNEHPALVAFMKYQNIECLTRDILVELVDHIKVYENGNISVRFKFADELRKIVEYIELNTEPRAQVV